MASRVISKIVPDALKGQLSAVGTGFNARLVELATSYTFEAFAIEWDETVSTNFMFGRIDPGLLEESSVFTYPFLTIDLLALDDTREIKYSVFSGPVIGLVEVHHSWQNESVIADFGALVNATSDALINCLNDANYQGWPGNLLWNGRASTRPGALKMGGLGWLKTTQFLCPFKLTV